MFAKDTLEDPSNRFERDGFLDEIERISEGTGVFDSTKFEALDVFLAAPGPSVVPEPEYVEHEGGAIDPSVGVEVAYALLAFTNRHHMDHARGSRISSDWSRDCRSRPMPHLRISSSCSRTSRPSPLPRLRPSGCRQVKWRSRSRVSATRGASAAPDAARHHPSCSSVGRCWTRPCIAAAADPTHGRARTDSRVRLTRRIAAPGRAAMGASLWLWMQTVLAAETSRAALWRDERGGVGLVPVL